MRWLAEGEAIIREGRREGNPVVADIHKGCPAWCIFRWRAIRRGRNRKQREEPNCPIWYEGKWFAKVQGLKPCRHHAQWGRSLARMWSKKITYCLDCNVSERCLSLSQSLIWRDWGRPRPPVDEWFARLPYGEGMRLCCCDLSARHLWNPIFSRSFSEEELTSRNSLFFFIMIVNIFLTTT